MESGDENHCVHTECVGVLLVFRKVNHDTERQSSVRIYLSN